MSVYCPQNTTTYTTLTDFFTAVAGTNWGVQCVGEVSGTTVADGYTLSSSANPLGFLIRAAAGEEFTGDSSAAFAKLSCGASTSLTIRTSVPVVFENVGFVSSWNYVSRFIEIGDYYASDLTVQNCYFKNPGTSGGTNRAILFTTRGHVQKLTAQNCVFHSCRSGGIQIQRQSAPSAGSFALIDNNTFLDCGAGGTEQIRLISAPETDLTITMTDNVAIGGGGGDFPANAVTRNNNASGDSSATGTGSVTGVTTSEFENYATGDFRIKSASSLVGAGSGGGDIGAFVQIADGATIAATQVVQTATASGAVTDPAGTIAATQTTQNATASASYSPPSDPSITTDPLKNNTGTVLSGQTVIASVYDISTGALVVRKTGLTSDGSGVVTFSDAAMAAATQYQVVLTIGTDDGITRVTTA